MKKVTEFVKGHRYYLMLLLVVMMVTAFTFVLRFNSERPEAEAELEGDNTLNNQPIYYERVAENDPILNNDEIVGEDPNDAIVLAPETYPELTDISDEMSEIKENPDDEALAEVFANTSEEVPVKSDLIIKKNKLAFKETDSIIMPVNGKIIIGYDTKNPVYFKTLDHFRISQALYIQPETSDKVKAVFDGRVQSISKDAVYGTLIVLEHGDGVQSIYGQVKLAKNLKAGDYVKQSEVIGNVIEPTKFFVNEGKHLYFKVLKNEKAVDPMSLLIQKSR